MVTSTARARVAFVGSWWYITLSKLESLPAGSMRRWAQLAGLLLLGMAANVQAVEMTVVCFCTDSRSLASKS